MPLPTVTAKYISLGELQSVANSSRILELLQDVTEGDENLIQVVERDVEGCWTVWAFRRSSRERSPVSEKERRAESGVYVEPDFFSSPLSEARALLSGAASKLKELVIENVIQSIS